MPAIDMKMSSKIRSRRIFPFATQLSATPPARQRYRSPVIFRTWRAILSIAISVTTWTEEARSISRCVSFDSGLRAGPPKSSSKAPFVIFIPVQ